MAYGWQGLSLKRRRMSSILFFSLSLASICNIVTLRTLSLQLEGPGPVIVFKGMFKGCKIISEELFVIISNVADLIVT